MPPKKKKGILSRPTPAACSASGGEATHASGTDRSNSNDSHDLPFESSPQLLPSTPDPSTVLRLLLASEASNHSIAEIARAYLQCIVTSSVPDDLRTPATIVLLGAECPSSRADRFMLAFLSSSFHHILDTHSHLVRYIQLLNVPPSPRDASSIDIDIPRTFKGDESFSSRVNRESLRRVLYSYSAHCHEQGLELSYVQGLNVICGMLLFNNSELHAFFCLCAFTLRFAPSHYVHNISGAHRAASCCDELLKQVDVEATHHPVQFVLFWDF